MNKSPASKSGAALCSVTILSLVFLGALIRLDDHCRHCCDRVQRVKEIGRGRVMSDHDLCVQESTIRCMISLRVFRAKGGNWIATYKGTPVIASTTYWNVFKLLRFL